MAEQFHNADSAASVEVAAAAAIQRKASPQQQYVHQQQQLPGGTADSANASACAASAAASTAVALLPPPSDPYAGELALCVTSHSVLYTADKPIVLYEVSALGSSGVETRRWKRFSEFDELNELLKKSGLSLPKLPRKEWHIITKHDSPGLIGARREKLSGWLGALAKLYVSAAVDSKNAIRMWLHLNVGWEAATHNAAVEQERARLKAPRSGFGGGGIVGSILAKKAAQKQAQAVADQAYLDSLPPGQREQHLAGLSLLARLSSHEGWCFVNSASGFAEWWNFTSNGGLERRVASGPMRVLTKYRYAPPTMHLSNGVIEMNLMATFAARDSAPFKVRIQAPAEGVAAPMGGNELLMGQSELGAAPSPKRQLRVEFVGCAEFFLARVTGSAFRSLWGANAPLTEADVHAMRQPVNTRIFVEAPPPHMLVTRNGDF